MNIKEYYSKFAVSLGSLVGATLSGLIVLVVDKHWEPNNPSENSEIGQQRGSEVAGIDAQNESMRIETDKKIDQAQSDLLNRQQKTLERSFSEQDSLNENRADEDQGNREASQVQSGEQIKTPEPGSTQVPMALNSEVHSNSMKPPFSSFSAPQNVTPVERIFEGERIDICGYDQFSVKSLDDGARFEISTEDRRMPNREFTGWRSTIPSGKVTSITPSCNITITSEVVGGNRLIYFKIAQGSEL